jgi:hypothetical protein
MQLIDTGLVDQREHHALALWNFHRTNAIDR